MLTRLPWLMSISLAVLALALSGVAARGSQTEPGTPVPVAEATPQATPLAANGVPLLTFAPVERERGFFELALAPGQSQTLALSLANIGPEPYRLVTYAADIYTRINGGSEARLRGEPASGATLWLDYPEETIDLALGADLIREFTVTVPEGTPPGEYTTSVVIQNLEPIGTSLEGNLSIRQILRQVVAVAITVPGPSAPALAIAEATYSLAPAYAAVLVTVENPGNVRLAPVATMVLTDAAGSEITSATLEMDTFLPGTTTNLEFQLVRTLAPGDYHVAVTLEDPVRQVRAEARELLMTIAEPEGTPVAETNINISSLEISEARDAAGVLQLVAVAVQIDNPGMQVANGRLTLRVTRDGEPVEELELGSSLTFPAGIAQFQQRYFPMEGWTPGVYEFAITLDSIDPNTGEPVTLDTVVAATTVTVE